MDTLSEDLLDVLSVICHWSTYHGTHCRRTIHKHNFKNKGNLCSLHKDLMVDYEWLKNSDELCETTKEIKIIPRSYKHIKNVMNKMGKTDDDCVDVYMAGGSIEEAYIGNENYIELVSDNSRYYYNYHKGQYKSKDLKIILKEYCPDDAVICARGTNYCEKCYKKVKNVPKFFVVKNNFKLPLNNKNLVE